MLDTGKFNQECLPLEWRHLSLDILKEDETMVLTSTLSHSPNEKENEVKIVGTIKGFLRKYPELTKEDSGYKIRFSFMDINGKWSTIVTCESAKFLYNIAFAKR